MFGFLKKFKDGLKKTSGKILNAFTQLLNREIDEDALAELEEALYEADLGVETVRDLVAEIRQLAKQDKHLQKQPIIDVGCRLLERFLEGSEATLRVSKGQQDVILLVGINGVGKTTTAAKLAAFFKAQGHGVILGACDTFRAAANEQIDIWSQRLGIDLVSSHHGADSAAVAFDTCQAAKSRQLDVVILDTAGRLHNKENLMGELAKMERVLQRQGLISLHKWLVIDGTLGSNSISQAQLFHQKIQLSGLIVTKLDGTSRGGALIGIYRQLRLPIYFVGLGEKVDDLQPFIIKDYVSGLFKSE
jgi:fused signal recognition particle receptor